MSISFDFDETISEEYIQEMAKVFIKGGAIVHIITSRTIYPGVLEHRDIYEVAKKLEIPEDRIHFTNMNMKLDKCEELGIDIHIDNKWDECDNINRNSKTCKAILIGLDISEIKYRLENQ